jgi:hypothetical protein
MATTFQLLRMEHPDGRVFSYESLPLNRWEVTIVDLSGRKLAIYHVDGDDGDYMEV